ncbi:hypothetical protein [Zhaonella formicivorans]|uniref:hypothetical protein n=1 Tax=Zhaonella formicivorans TaxID=2528593 RepID=UPI0010D7CE4F|nr:hypothetical protein [Zhaonella formicivorans]
MCLETRNSLQQLAQEAASIEKILQILAVISAYVESKGSKIVVVGTSAVAIYTFGGHLEQNIEIVFLGSDKARTCFQQIGFYKESGRRWHHEDLKITLEVVDHELHGDLNKVVEFEIGERSVAVIGYEDLIIDCLHKAMHRGELNSQEQALAILLTYYDFIDLPYLRRRAKEEKVIGLVEELLEEID